MKPKWNTPHWIVILVWAVCTQATAEPFAEGPYLGQKPPGPVAQVFAPGLITDVRPRTWESCGTFSADGNTFCYLRCSVRRSPRAGGIGQLSFRNIYRSDRTALGWTAPQKLGPACRDTSHRFCNFTAIPESYN